MGIYREVNTIVTCDMCKENITGWSSTGTGVSKAWATHYARIEGATVGKKGVMCKECRIAERQRKCGLIKKVGHPGKDEDEKYLGFDIMENCKRCIAYTGFDWEKEARKFKF